MAMINLTYQYKLKLNKQQTQEIEHNLDVCKSVYNYALAERKHWYNSRKSLADRCSIHSEFIIPANVPYLKVNKNGTSQECSNCGHHTGKKYLSERIHNFDVRPCLKARGFFIQRVSVSQQDFSN